MANAKDQKLKKILVVDDEPQILFMVTNRLKMNGYEVVGASLGDQAIQMARQTKPDLIFLDQVMPGMQGDDVLRALKSDPLTRSIPVIMFTADVKKVRVGEYQSMGAEDVLYKPFLPEELLGKVKKILG